MNHGLYKPIIILGDFEGLGRKPFVARFVTQRKFYLDFASVLAAHMSAFSVLNLKSGLDFVFSNDSISQEGDEDAQLRYSNSSGEDDDESETPKLTTPFVSDVYRSIPHELPPVYKSNISLSEKNCVVNVETQSLEVKLFEREHILINGQFNLKIIKGSCLFNGHYHLRADALTVYPVLASQSQALPVLSHEPLDGQASETILLISPLHSGLENIGAYHSPLKNIFYRGTDTSYSKDSLMSSLNNPSFEIVSADKGLLGLQIHPLWTRTIENISRRLVAQKSPPIVMAIGNKNTGKSTFTKTLLNTSLLHENAKPVCYMDLDPGQSEFSPPYCLSLSIEQSPIFGLNCSQENSVSHYYGFTSAASNPDRYVRLVTSLFDVYRELYAPQGYSLIINTPGWVRGFGKELLIEISALLKPLEMIVLSNSNDPLNADNQDLLRDLLFERAHHLPGAYQTSKFSHSQLREYNKIAYFHRVSPQRYDFESRLLDSSPLKILFRVRGSDTDFQGIDSISVLNFVFDKTFAGEDIFLLLEATIAGIYLVPNAEYAKKKVVRSKAEDSPYYMNPGEFDSLNLRHTVFAGLIMTHSINREKMYINAYMPFNVKAKLLSYNANEYKLMLIKGDGEIPSCEVLHPAFIAKLKNLPSTSDVSFPYISTKTQTGLGGIWKVRRNVMRRGHARK